MALFGTSSAAMTTTTMTTTARLSRVKRFQICLVVSAFLVLFSIEREMMMNAGDIPPEDISIKQKNNTTTKSSPSSSSSSIRSPSTPISSPITNDNKNIATAPSPSPIKVGTVSDHNTPVTSTTTSTSTMSGGNTVKLPNGISSSHSSTSTSTTTTHDDQFMPNVPSNSSSFVSEFCDLAPLKSWYPDSQTQNWQIRAPHVIIAGVWNAGVNDVAQHLITLTNTVTNDDNENNNNNEPTIILQKSKSDGFFLPRQFKKFIIRSKTKVFGAREKMNAQIYDVKLLKKEEEQQHKVTNGEKEEEESTTITTTTRTMHYYMDVSPGYVFYPTTINSILCVAPWTKIVILLRDPVERLYRQWVYGRTRLGLKLSLEDWMAREIKVMQSVGLIQTSSDNNNNNNQGRRKLESVVAEMGDEETSSSSMEHPHNKDERQAWRDYHNVQTSITGAIGRSLYILQLQEWFDAIQKAGKNPKDVMYIVPSEILLDGDDTTQKIEEYSKLMKFLSFRTTTMMTTTTSSSSSISTLESISLKRSNKYSNNNIPPMNQETKEMLQDFFTPYNERLANLLKNHGFEDYSWNEIWK